MRTPLKRVFRVTGGIVSTIIIVIAVVVLYAISKSDEGKLVTSDAATPIAVSLG